MQQSLISTKNISGLAILLIVLFNQIRASAQSDSLMENTFSSKIHPCPVITFSPETSLGFGITAFKLFHSGTENRTSNITGTAIYTIKNQVLLESATTVFFDREKWLTKGKVNFKQFPEYFYGVGEITSHDRLAKVDYTYYNIQGMLYRNIVKGLFVGAQSTYNRYFNVSTSNDAALSANNIVGRDGARNLGIGLGLLYDTRNNVLNASSGVYIELSEMYFSKALGSDFQYNAFQIDMRRFISVSPKSVLAFQFVGMVKTGEVPFLQLSYLGGSDIMRGFYAGRYRDKDFIAAQAEYRRQITEHWGMVAFVGLGNVTDKLENYDFTQLKRSVGIGARMTLDKKERVNLRLDMGMGNGQLNFYANIAEAF